MNESDVAAALGAGAANAAKTGLGSMLGGLFGGIIGNATSVDTTPAVIDVSNQEKKGVSGSDITLILISLLSVIGFGMLAYIIFRTKK